MTDTEYAFVLMIGSQCWLLNIFERILDRSWPKPSAIQVENYPSSSKLGLRYGSKSFRGGTKRNCNPVGIA